MALVDADMDEDLIFPNLLEYLNSDLSEETELSLQESWAESCLNTTMDTSNTDWTSVKDVLLEILSAQAGPEDSSAPDTVRQPMDEESYLARDQTYELFGRSSGEEDELDELFLDDTYFLDNQDGDAEWALLRGDDDEGVQLGNGKGRVKRGKHVQNVFRPLYSEDTPTVDKLGSALELEIIDDREPPIDEIFRVWDLGTSDEQDDFTQLLNKATDETTVLVQSTTDTSTVSKDSNSISVDDLISGVDHLSLTQFT